MKELTIILVKKLTDLNGFAREKIWVHRDHKEFLAISDSVFDGKRVCHIKKKVFSTDGELIIFVETINSLPIDDSFIEDYFKISKGKF